MGNHGKSTHINNLTLDDLAKSRSRSLILQTPNSSERDRVIIMLLLTTHKHSYIRSLVAPSDVNLSDYVRSSSMLLIFLLSTL